MLAGPNNALLLAYRWLSGAGLTQTNWTVSNCQSEWLGRRNMLAESSRHQPLNLAISAQRENLALHYGDYHQLQHATRKARLIAILGEVPNPGQETNKPSCHHCPSISAQHHLSYNHIDGTLLWPLASDRRRQKSANCSDTLLSLIANHKRSY